MMQQPAVPETRQLREERIQRARPPSYEYGIEILATLYVCPLIIIGFPMMFWVLPIVVKAYLPDLDKHFVQITNSDVSKLSVIGSFVGFFTLFYTNQCYGRWWDSYKTSMSCEGRIFDTGV